MKKLFTLLAALLFVYSGFSQVPEKMSYQAMVRDANGNLIKSSTIGMQLSILPGSESGIAIYVETQTTSTNENGLITIEIGNGTTIIGTFSEINWSSDKYFLKTETDPSGGTNYTITGTSQLLSVPYALYAKSSGSSNDAVKLTGDQTISGNKTFGGTITVAVPVNDTDAANKAYVDELKSQANELNTQIEELQISAGLAIRDIEGNVYKIVTIRTQTWMAENLKTTKYNDGIEIPMISDQIEWNNSTTPAYCWYNNDQVTLGEIYGALYNWHTVNTGKLCPTGWHVPSLAEWTTLETFIGGPTGTSAKLKETGTSHWIINEGATNETGFTALPGGYRAASFDGVGYEAYFWSSSEVASIYGGVRWVVTSGNDFGSQSDVKDFGHSVRCIKD